MELSSDQRITGKVSISRWELSSAYMRTHTTVHVNDVHAALLSKMISNTISVYKTKIIITQNEKEHVIF